MVRLEMATTQHRNTHTHFRKDLYGRSDAERIYRMERRIRTGTHSVFCFYGIQLWWSLLRCEASCAPLRNVLWLTVVVGVAFIYTLSESDSEGSTDNDDARGTLSTTLARFDSSDRTRVNVWCVPSLFCDGCVPAVVPFRAASLISCSRCRLLL